MIDPALGGATGDFAIGNVRVSFSLWDPVGSTTSNPLFLAQKRTAFQGFSTPYPAVGQRLCRSGELNRWATSHDCRSMDWPADPGTRQQVFIEYLTAGQAYTFFVQAYDKAGNTGSVAHTGFTLPAAVPTPTRAA